MAPNILPTPRSTTPRTPTSRATRPSRPKHANRSADTDTFTPTQYHLTPTREAELLREAESLGDSTLTFPGKLARRVVWASRIQLAAERDAADLVKTPFSDDEPPLTLDEIHGLRDRIELLRRTQSRWMVAYQTQQKATTTFGEQAAEAAQHKQTLLRFFDLRFKSNLEGQKRISAIREGKGDADLIQDVSDLLLLCTEHEEAIAKAPRGEGVAAARLGELSPMLSRLLADKTLSPEAVQARKRRDAAYTLAQTTERRIRTAAEYWYAGTEKMKDYAVFSSPTSAAAEAEDEVDAPAADAADKDAEAAGGDAGDTVDAADQKVSASAGNAASKKAGASAGNAPNAADKKVDAPAPA